MTKTVPNTKKTPIRATQSSRSARAPKQETPAALSANISKTTKAKASVSRKDTSPAAGAAASKQDLLIALMKQAKGSTMADLMAATGWQAHSVRGVISGVLKKRLNLNVILEASADGVRRYRILKSVQA